MPPAAPITLTLYDKDNEQIKNLTRVIVPWGILKKAIGLTKAVDFSDISKLDEADVDAIAGLVVQIFDGQVTLGELDSGADVGDMIAVIESIIARSGALVKENPTFPPPKKKPSK